MTFKDHFSGHAASYAAYRPGYPPELEYIVMRALSKDDCLQSKGTATGINWHLEYESYLQYLLKGLRQRKASIVNIFRVWNKTLFPHTNESLSRKSMHITTTVEATRDALDALNADDEDNGDLGETDNRSGEASVGSDDE